MSEHDPFKKIEQYAVDEAAGAVHWLTANALGDTEIEKVFYVALETVLRHDYRSHFVLRHHHEAQEPILTEGDIDSIIIRPQVQIAKYRVDFLIYAWHYMGAEYNGYKFIYDEKLWRRLIIECDGHDYHERTKEQAARDRSRDRELIAAGYTVFRFTGSELWRNPIKCGVEVLDWCCT